MRICQFSDSYLPVVDGVGRVMVSYVRELSALGHQVTAVGVGPGGALGEVPGYRYVPIRGVRLPPACGAYRVGLPRADLVYRHEIRGQPIDIAHAHSPFGAGRAALRTARRLDIPLVGTFHSKFRDDFLKITRSRRMADYAVRRVVSFYETCDEVWAVGDSTANVLRDYGYRGDVIVMPNGVERRALDAGALREVQARWPLGDAPLLLFVGQMNFKKNLRLLLSACALLRARGAAFYLALAGQGPDERGVAGLVRSLGLHDRAILTGHLYDHRLLDALYARASLLVFPSLYDNAPMVVREAAAMGTPSVLVKGSCAADGVRDGVNGYLCADDANDLCRAIDCALRDPGRSDVGLRAQREIAVPWRDIMVEVEARYQNLIDRRAARPARLSRG
ncbi:MAG: glycosyltransferase family 4 protein [Clostridiales bacterium]|nr:glycosyltransferase family 4 protein [Clostridiales bacterium]